MTCLVDNKCMHPIPRTPYRRRDHIGVFMGLDVGGGWGGGGVGGGGGGVAGGQGGGGGDKPPTKKCTCTNAAWHSTTPRYRRICNSTVMGKCK